MPKEKDILRIIEDDLSRIKVLSQEASNISVENVRILISLVNSLFRYHLISNGIPKNQITPLCTKFRDAGRRSAPWKQYSERVPGRPQDGADGNRIRRWALEPDHKFYANEVDATLVEIKYYFQAFSMEAAPPLPNNSIQNDFLWLLGHPIEPNNYFDPIQLIPIDLSIFIENPRIVQSGHLIPLDRGGRHIPSNTFLMLAISNQLQGNQTVDELITLMDQIVKRHQSKQSN